MKFILALDQGTTSSRALLFDKEGNIRTVAQQEFEQKFPQPGWVEHDPEEIASSQIRVAQQALSKLGVRPSDVAAISIKEKKGKEERSKRKRRRGRRMKRRKKRKKKETRKVE